MHTPPARFYFDFVDPVSHLMERELRAAEADLGIEVARIGFELRPPPSPVADPSDPAWRERWAHARELDPALATPGLVPWSRKAHELHLHAAGLGLDGAAREAILRAFFEERKDIGRVDVLVELAGSLGLDRTQAKVALDIDLHRDRLGTLREEALAAGVSGTPTLVSGADRLEGFHKRTDLSTFLTRT